MISAQSVREQANAVVTALGVAALYALVVSVLLDDPLLGHWLEIVLMALVFYILALRYSRNRRDRALVDESGASRP